MEVSVRGPGLPGRARREVWAGNRDLGAICVRIGIRLGGEAIDLPGDREAGSGADLREAEGKAGWS